MNPRHSYDKSELLDTVVREGGSKLTKTRVVFYVFPYESLVWRFGVVIGPGEFDHEHTSIA